MNQDKTKKPRNRSNPTKDGPIEIKISLTLLADKKEKKIDIRGFDIEPSDELSIADIGTLLGQNVVAFLMQNMKPVSNIKV